MVSSVIIIGAKGRFGRSAIHAFQQAGWNVRAFARNWQSDRPHSNVEVIEGDAFDQNSLIKACEGVDVIVNALNPAYEHWKKELPRLTANVIAAANASRATVMIPGNVYNYGANVSPSFNEKTPHEPNTGKGKLRMEMERSYRDATNDSVRTIVLCSGDYIERKQTGNWFDTYIAAKANQGKVTYPGPLNAKHAWAFLPDVARAMVELAAIRDRLEPFDEFCFESYNLTGQELVTAIEIATGISQKVSRFPWPIVKLIGFFSPHIREVIEMRYLWQIPHSIDGSKFAKTVPDFSSTPIDVAFKDALNEQVQELALLHSTA